MLDERQAAIMKAQGYQWDAERRRWYRGDPTRRVRAECRSGGRFIRFVDAEGETATGTPTPALTLTLTVTLTLTLTITLTLTVTLTLTRRDCDRLLACRDRSGGALRERRAG